MVRKYKYCTAWMDDCMGGMCKMGSIPPGSEITFITPRFVIRNAVVLI